MRQYFLGFPKDLEEASKIGDKDSLLIILKEVAQCYFNINDYSNAIENYGKAHEIAKNKNLTDECYYMLLKIAEIYKQTYKTDLAKEIYSDIVAQENLPPYISVEAELNLFELNFNNMNSNDILKNYYKLSILKI